MSLEKVTPIFSFKAFPVLDITEYFKAIYHIVATGYGLDMAEGNFIAMGKGVLAVHGRLS